ncbi:hypothetical protein LXL04_033164 [Taraxacum kok-saghyz]
MLVRNTSSEDIANLGFVRSLANFGVEQLPSQYLGVLKDIGSSENPIVGVDDILDNSIRNTICIQSTSTNIFELARGGIVAISGPSIDSPTTFKNAEEIEKTSIDIFQNVTLLQNDFLVAAKVLDSSENSTGRVDDNLDTLILITLGMQDSTRRIFEFARDTNFAISETSIDPDEVVPNPNLLESPLTGDASDSSHEFLSPSRNSRITTDNL